LIELSRKGDSFFNPCLASEPGIRIHDKEMTMKNTKKVGEGSVSGKKEKNRLSPKEPEIKHE